MYIVTLWNGFVISVIHTYSYMHVRMHGHTHKHAQTDRHTHKMNILNVKREYLIAYRTNDRIYTKNQECISNN